MKWELYERVLDDGRIIAVIPLTFDRARIIVSRKESPMWLEDGW